MNKAPMNKIWGKNKKKATFVPIHHSGLSVCQKRNSDAQAVSASRLMFPCFDFKILRI